MFALVLTVLASTCPEKGTAVIVETGAHRMTLCDGGVEVKQYKVAIGSGGIAKKRVAFGQTPLGT